MMDIQGDEAGLLLRWSRRKLDKKDSEEIDESQIVTDNLVEVRQTEENELSVPIWQRKDIDSDIKKQVLNNLFRQPEFNHLDGLNDYDEDFTKFTNLGDMITEEMRRMLRLTEAKKDREAQLPMHKAVVQVDEQEINPNIDKKNKDEGNKFA